HFLDSDPACAKPGFAVAVKATAASLTRSGGPVTKSRTSPLQKKSRSPHGKRHAKTALYFASILLVSSRASYCYRHHAKRTRLACA
ncbi:hypothetical protein, partial [Cohnella laeviribosi]|uniref:hypothetical protein n=1 Tax=Cohnella laeviribosi TaxID=380174 RepID=UPI003D1DA111